MYIQLKQTDLKPFREYWLKKQNNICPILNIPIDDKDAVVDHKHTEKLKNTGEDYNKLCRGVIHRGANALEGKIWNFYIRSGLRNTGVPLQDILRNLADYLDNPPIPPLYIHPNEAEKPLKIKKREFNKLAKLYTEKYPNRKPLTFPKSGKLTKHLKQVADEFNITLS